MFGGNNNQMFSSNPTTEDQEKGQGPKEDSGLGQMREQLAVSIRKNDRDQEIMKRRKMNSTAVVTQELPLETDPFQAKIREYSVSNLGSRRDSILSHRSINSTSACRVGISRSRTMGSLG